MTEINQVAVKPNKRWWKSRTLWFVAFIEGLAVFEANFSILQPYLPGNVYAYMLVTLAVGVKILRFLTSQGIGK